MKLESKWKVRHIENFLKKYPLEYHIKEINYDLISTYDGEYPNFVIKLDETKKSVSSLNKDIIKEEITKELLFFFNLKFKKDYWISIN